jgi:hypothetical protein
MGKLLEIFILNQTLCACGDRRVERLMICSGMSLPVFIQEAYHLIIEYRYEVSREVRRDPFHAKRSVALYRRAVQVEISSAFLEAA